MRARGSPGVVRARTVRTALSDAKAPCPQDRVNREFHAERPNRLWVSDFTYVSTWQGLVHVAFQIDVYAPHRRLAREPLDACRLRARRAGAGAVREEAAARWRADPSFRPRLAHVSIRYTERLAEAGIEPSVGSKGDSHDDDCLLEPVGSTPSAEAEASCRKRQFARQAMLA